VREQNPSLKVEVVVSDTPVSDEERKRRLRRIGERLERLRQQRIRVERGEP
jgi:hypothetical protein